MQLKRHCERCRRFMVIIGNLALRPTPALLAHWYGVYVGSLKGGLVCRATKRKGVLGIIKIVGVYNKLRCRGGFFSPRIYHPSDGVGKTRHYAKLHGRY